MAWNEGLNPRHSKFEGVNEKLMKLEGYLDESKAKHYLYEFLRANPTFAAELLYGIRVFPYQSMAIKATLEADYNLFIWSRGASKTWTSAVALMNYCIFNQGVKVGLLSASFRQSKLLLSKIDDILAKPEASLGRACLTKISRAPDICEYTFGESKLIALPLGSGEKLRGFRFNLICIDEFLLMPQGIYNEVIMPFLGVAQNPDKIAILNKIEDKLIKEGKMKVEDKHVWPSNKLLMLSSASYKFEYLYKVYETFETLITEGKERDEYGDWVTPKDKASRCIMHFSYDVIPPEIYDENMINQAKSTMSEAQFAREFGAVFTDESDGYFKMSTIQKRCCTEDYVTEIKGDDKSEYILSIDPSWSESASSDDFALQILKIIPNTEKAVLVHSYAMPGQKLTSHFNYLLYVLKNFNIKLIVFDRNGGDVFMQAFNEYAGAIAEGINLKVIDLDFEDQTEYEKNLRDFNNQYNKLEWRICFQRNPSTTWIRNANELLQANFDHAKTLFAAKPDDKEYVRQVQSEIDIDSLIFDRTLPKYKDSKEKKIDFIEIQYDNLTYTKTQVSTIVVRITDLGTQQFGLPLSLKKLSGGSKVRKDSYSALLLGVWGHKIWVDAHSEKAAPIVATFTPMFIG